MDPFVRSALRVSLKLFLNLVVPFAIALVLGGLLYYTLPQCLAFGLALVFAAYTVCSGIDWPTFEALGEPLIGILMLAVLAVLWWYGFVHEENTRLLSMLLVVFPAVPFAVETVIDLFFGRD